VKQRESMAPATSFNGTGTNHLVVAWDLDTTGRRLIDEICQIGGYYVIPASANAAKEGHQDEGHSDAQLGQSSEFSQYVMPYGTPNPGARRSFGIKVVNVGRYRMLKDMNSGKVLKTKSEVSAIQDFIEWLEEGRVRAGKEGVLLACHELNRKVLVPLLLEAVHKYNLSEAFEATVKGFVNGVHVVESLGSKEVITSNSLRSLCKTVLGDTNPDTVSASDRSKLLIQIIAQVCAESGSCGVKGGSGDDVVGQGGSNPAAVSMDCCGKLLHLATSVTDEVGKLKHLKGMLDTLSTLRPIFEQQLKQKRSVRDRAMTLRRLAAESGMDYKAVEAIYNSAAAAAAKTKRPPLKDEAAATTSEESSSSEFDEVIKAGFKAKIPEATDEDLAELALLCKEHFSQKTPTQSTTAAATAPAAAATSTEAAPTATAAAPSSSPAPQSAQPAAAATPTTANNKKVDHREGGYDKHSSYAPNRRYNNYHSNYNNYNNQYYGGGGHHYRGGRGGYYGGGRGGGGYYQGYRQHQGPPRGKAGGHRGGHYGNRQHQHQPNHAENHAQNNHQAANKE